MSSSSVFVACFTGSLFALVFVFVFGVQIIWWLAKRWVKRNLATIMQKLQHEMLHGEVSASEWAEVLNSADKAPPDVVSDLEKAICQHCGMAVPVPLGVDFDATLVSTGWIFMTETDVAPGEKIGWWCRSCVVERRNERTASLR